MSAGMPHGGGHEPHEDRVPAPLPPKKRAFVAGTPVRLHAPLRSIGSLKLGGLANLRDVVPGLSQLSEKLLGLTSKRELPQWDSQPFCPEETSQKTTGPEVVLFADSFNTYFEPQVLRDGFGRAGSSGTDG